MLVNWSITFRARQIKAFEWEYCAKQWFDPPHFPVDQSFFDSILSSTSRCICPWFSAIFQTSFHSPSAQWQALQTQSPVTTKEILLALENAYQFLLKSDSLSPSLWQQNGRHSCSGYLIRIFIRRSQNMSIQKGKIRQKRVKRPVSIEASLDERCSLLFACRRDLPYDSKVCEENWEMTANISRRSLGAENGCKFIHLLSKLCECNTL